MYQRQDLLLSLIAGNLFAHGAPMQLLQHLLSRSSCITDLQTYGITRKNFLLNSQHTLVFVYGNVHTLAGLESVWIIFYALGLSRTFRSWNNHILSY